MNRNRLISAVILDDQSRILVQDHIKANALTPIGGKVDKGESPFDAVAREIKEETGLTPEQYRINGFYQNSYTSLDADEYMFAVQLVSGNPENLEPSKHRWQEFKTLSELESLKRERKWGLALINAIKLFPHIAK